MAQVANARNYEFLLHSNISCEDIKLNHNATSFARVSACGVVQQGHPSSSSSGSESAGLVDLFPNFEVEGITRLGMDFPAQSAGASGHQPAACSAPLQPQELGQGDAAGLDLDYIGEALDFLETQTALGGSGPALAQTDDALPTWNNNQAFATWPSQQQELTRSDSATGSGHSSGSEGNNGKKVGRPRASRPPPVKQTTQGKRTRGPKPKYVFQSSEAAADARRERNRQAALESYYRKRQHTQLLEAEIARLQQENDALTQLHQQIVSGSPHSLLEASEAGIDSWLISNAKSTTTARERVQQ